MGTLKLTGDDFIDRYKGIVLNIVKKYFAYRENIEANGGHTKEDLIQYGMLALMKAKVNYDPSKAKFSTYLYTKVNGELLSVITENTLVKVPRNINRVNLLINKQHIQDLPVNEIADQLGVPEEDIRVAFKNPTKYISGNQRVKDETDQDTEIQDILPSKFNLEEYVINKIILQQFLNTLDEIEKYLWFKVYEEKIEQSVLADQLGLSRVKVNRILIRVKKKAKIFGESIYEKHGFKGEET